MTEERAFQINEACMLAVMESMDALPPGCQRASLTGISLAEAIEACHIVAVHNRNGGEQVDGGRGFRRTINPALLPDLFAGQVIRRQNRHEMILPEIDEA